MKNLDSNGENLPVKSKVLTRQVLINRIKYKYFELESYLLNNNINTQYYPINKIIDLIDEWGISLYNKINKVYMDSTMECTICMETQDIKYMCSTECGHIFCYKCICISYSNNTSCPMCRSKLNLKNLLPLVSTRFSKLEKLKENIIKEVKLFEKVLIYVKSTLIPYINDFLQRERINKCVLNNRRGVNIKDINAMEQIIMIIDGNKCDVVKEIKGIKKIIVMDREYDYILKKENIGYDFLHKLNGIIIDIYEPIE